MRGERERIISKLRELGFPEYEALAYVALVELGEGTAEEVSRKSGIPLPRVYSVLDSLERKGFVEVLGGRPKRYSLQDPRRAIGDYLEEKRRELEEAYERLRRLWDDLYRLIEPYYMAHRLEIEPEELMIPLSSLDMAEEKTRELIKSAEEEISIMSNTFSWADKVLNLLGIAVGKGIRVKVLMRVDDLTMSRVSKLKAMGIDVRAHPLSWYPVRCTIVDSRRAVFVIWAKPPIKGVGYIYRPHYTENPGMVKLLSDVFNLYWERGEKVS